MTGVQTCALPIYAVLEVRVTNDATDYILLNASGGTNVASSLTSLGTFSVVGNSNLANIGINGLLTASGNITGGNFITTGNISAGNISVSGNVDAANINGNLKGALSNGTSNVNIPVADGNVNISSAGNANILVITGTGSNVYGTLGVSGNSYLANLGLTGLITAAGNVTAGNLVTGGALSVTGNANIGNIGTGGILSVTEIGRAHV